MNRLIAKLIETEEGQAILLPKEIKIKGNEIFLEQRGQEIILIPKPNSWAEFFAHVPHENR